MKMFKSAAQTPSRSTMQLETEVHALQLKLQKAEATIRLLRGEAADQAGWKEIEDSLRQSEGRLEIELADTKLLQGISSHLIREETDDSFYGKIAEAARSIMQSDFSSLQMFHPERGMHGELRMLASCGLSREDVDFWAWAGKGSGATCAVAMRTGKRIIVSDLLNCEFVKNTLDHAAFIQAGIKAAQTTPLFSRSGTLLGMISTHWKHHHAPSDRDLNLLDILARQAADLIERKMAQEALAQADRHKDEFLATLAHELRNPLAPIRNALHIMRADPSGANAPELLNMMDRQVTHLVRLIDDLLDVSRLSQGKIDLRKERITLQSAIGDAAEASRPLIESSKHQLTLDLPEAPIWIYADITRIAQILSNLLNNAAKYTPPGGHITLTACEEGAYAVFSVADDGVGIPADMLPKVFDLFTQVDRDLARSQGGLGIGLALVKQLLEMHEGKIEAVSSGAGHGSTFTVRLPLAAPPEIDAQFDGGDIASAEPAQTKPLRVLVVDDNGPSAQTIGWLIEMDGHKYKLAHDGAEALTVAETYHPDAILLDIGLPGMNGYDLCRELRKDPRYRNTLMIAQTGWGQERDRQLAKEAGFDHHLVKPVSFVDLSKLLANADSTGAARGNRRIN